MHLRKIAIIALATLTVAGTVSTVAYAAGRRSKTKAQPKSEATAGPQKTAPYSISRFKSLDVSSSVDVKYTVAPTVSMTAKGQEEDLKYLTVKSENGTLKITRSYPVGYRRQNYDGIEVTLTGPAAEKINLTGTATLRVDSSYTLAGKSLTLRLEGATRATFSGTVNARVINVGISGASRVAFGTETSSSTSVSTSGSSTCTFGALRTGLLGAATSGSSRITLSGTAQKAELSSSGASSINASALHCDNTTVSSTGASHIKR